MSRASPVVDPLCAPESSERRAPASRWRLRVAPLQAQQACRVCSGIEGAAADDEGFGAEGFGRVFCDDRPVDVGGGFGEGADQGEALHADAVGRNEKTTYDRIHDRLNAT